MEFILRRRTLIKLRKAYKGNAYFEWYSLGTSEAGVSTPKDDFPADKPKEGMEAVADIAERVMGGTVDAHESIAKPVVRGVAVKEKPRDNIQERILRGMCGNQASAMINAENTLGHEKRYAETHLALTKAIYAESKDWYEGLDNS